MLTITIGLLWHSISSDNLGVGALTYSQIAICQAAARRANVEIEFIVFGTSGSSQCIPEDVNLKIGSRISLKKMLLGGSDFVREVSECDVVFDIGEGDSFTDIYGAKRFAFLLFSKIAVLLKRLPLVLSPQTIGPFENWIFRLAAVAVMRRCRKVFARDGLSLAYLKKLKIGEVIEESTDLSFRLSYKPAELQVREKVRVGINVSGLLFYGGYTGKNQFGLTIDYPRLLVRLIEAWTIDTRNEVWLIPHVVPDDLPNDDDRRAIQVLREQFPAVHVAPKFDSPSEAKSFIAGMEFVTGARMHACIAAFSAGVAVVPLAYSRKFNGLFESMNYPWYCDGRVDSADQAFEKIMDGFARREELVKLIKKGNAMADAKLMRYEDYVTDLLRTLASISPHCGGH